MNRLPQAISFLFFGIVPVVVGVACSNSEDAAPSRTVVPAGTTTTSSSSGGNTLTDGGDVDANVDPSCLSAAGCFTCDATRSIDILNSCTDDTCLPFDNAALPLYAADKPLPAIP